MSQSRTITALKAKKPKMHPALTALTVAVLALGLILVAGAGAQPLPQDRADLSDDSTIGPIERAMLEVLTPAQHAAFADGADPRSLVLASGETLAEFIDRQATKGLVTEGMVYFPVPRCTVLATWASLEGKMAVNETREFVVRGETTDLSDQGGSATGCGVPEAAESVMANFRVSDHRNRSGRLRVNASDQSAGYPLIHYRAGTYTNASVLDLCLAAACPSDFRVRTQSAGAHVRMDLLGYFAPLGTGGLSTEGTTTTDALTISGLDCTAHAGGGALTTDASGVVSCSDDDAGDDLGSHTATQNLDLATFKLVGNGGSDGLSIAADGTATFDGAITAEGGIDLDMGTLQQQPGALSLTSSLSIGDSPLSVYVSGRYAYVVESGSDALEVIDVSDPSAPSLVGSLGIGGQPNSIFVSGRYAYVVDQGSDDLKVIDVSDPSAPSLAGSLGIGLLPKSVFVSGHYAYVVDSQSDDLKVIDVSDPSAPSLAGSLGIGFAPLSVFVSGRFAYVTDEITEDLRVIDVSDPTAPSLAGSLGIGGVSLSVYASGRYAYAAVYNSGELKVIDVSDPSAPSLAGSLGIGGGPRSVFVSGRYAYVVNEAPRDLKVIDVLDPSAPSLAGSLGVGGIPWSVFVSGRYAYVADSSLDELKVIDVSGAELGSAIVHSLEAGSLQVRESLLAQGQLQVTGGVNIGTGGLFSDGNVGISGILALANDIAPTSSPANLVQLYAEDVAGSSELRVRDEAGNVTTLSPHNFSLVSGPSEPLAWSYYSENDHGTINVDMLRAMRVLESVSGEKLVHTDTEVESDAGTAAATEMGLKARVEALTARADVLLQRNRELTTKLARIEELLGID